MPELIDKKETIAKVFALSGFFVDRSDYEFEIISAVIHRCCEEISKQPTIEAEPVRHGRWVQRRNGEYYCANCGREERFIFHKYFCPNCGARMDVTDTNDGGKGGDDNG